MNKLKIIVTCGLILIMHVFGYAQSVSFSKGKTHLSRKSVKEIQKRETAKLKTLLALKDGKQPENKAEIANVYDGTTLNPQKLTDQIKQVQQAIATTNALTRQG